MQRVDSSSSVRPLRRRRARSLAPRKWLLRVCWDTPVKLTLSNFRSQICVPPALSCTHPPRPRRVRGHGNGSAQMKPDVLVLGASYGSLLGTKLLLAGYRVTLVCTRPTAELIRREGTRVRFPVRGRDTPLEIASATLP